MKKKHKQNIPLTIRQKKYVKAIAVDNLPKNYALMKAGYAPGTNPTTIEKSGTIQNAMIQALKKAGLTEDKIAEKMADGLEATESRFFSEKGVVTDERTVADYHARHKYISSYLEISKYIKGNTIENLNLGVIQIPQISSEKWNSEADASTPTTENKLPSGEIASITDNSDNAKSPSDAT